MPLKEFYYLQFPREEGTPHPAASHMGDSAWPAWLGGRRGEYMAFIILGRGGEGRGGWEEWAEAAG